MPWGWECRSKLVKQLPAKPTVRRATAKQQPVPPGPNHYDTPPIVGGNGYNKIKRAPAYTFGNRTPVSFNRPAAKPNAPVFNICGLMGKGTPRITHSVITPHIEPPRDKLVVPGPSAYEPHFEASLRCPPAYSIQPVAKPPYQPWDMWTPSSNMYCPPITSRKAPAYSFGAKDKELKPQTIPGPGEHEPNYKFAKKTQPSFSFGYAFPEIKLYSKIPAPNAHCEKKFMYTKRTIPAPSFGIRHSPYLGKQTPYSRSSKTVLADD